MTTISTSLPPHDEQTSRSFQTSAEGRHLGRIGLDLVPTRLPPRDQPDMACSRVGDRHPPWTSPAGSPDCRPHGESRYRLSLVSPSRSGRRGTEPTELEIFTAHV